MEFDPAIGFEGCRLMGIAILIWHRCRAPLGRVHTEETSRVTGNNFLDRLTCSSRKCANDVVRALPRMVGEALLA
jgi:hypothetical protein